MKRTAKKVVKEIEDDAKEKEKKPNSFEMNLRTQNEVMEQKRMEE